MGAFLFLLPPLGDLAFQGLAPRPVFFGFEQRQQSLQGRRGIAYEVHFHRIANRQHARVDVDLHAARAALFREELGIGETGTDHQQRVAALHHLP
jgi:hypothetical protein